MLWHFKQIVSQGDNLLEMSEPTFYEKTKNKKSVLKFCLLSIHVNMWKSDFGSGKQFLC